MSSHPTRVLFVCLGNICRSPAAEGVFLDLLAKEDLSHAFEVDSAGTGSWHVGQRADSRMRAAAQRRGIELHSRARQIQPEDLESFDWIITMDDSNLQNVRALDPTGVSHERIVPLTGHCSRHSTGEVPDPYYGGDQGFEQVLDLLEDACEGLLMRLR